MLKINMHEAKTQLSRLIDNVVVKGESFVIAKAGKPLVKVIPFTLPATFKVQRLGFLKNHFHIPDDFDRMGHGSTTKLFEEKL